ncbi:hypothetical protein D3C87_1359300 [compost metagenome]
MTSQEISEQQSINVEWSIGTNHERQFTNGQRFVTVEQIRISTADNFWIYTQQPFGDLFTFSMWVIDRDHFDDLFNTLSWENKGTIVWLRIYVCIVLQMRSQTWFGVDSVVTEYVCTNVGRSRSLLTLIEIPYHRIDTRNNHVGYVVLDLAQSSSYETNHVSIVFFDSNRLFFVHFFEVVFYSNHEFFRYFWTGGRFIYSIAACELSNRKLRIRNDQHLTRFSQLLCNQLYGLHGVGDIRHDVSFRLRVV